MKTQILPAAWDVLQYDSDFIILTSKTSFSAPTTWTNKQMNELVDDFINRLVSKEASQPASSSPHKGSLEYEFEIQTAKTN